jgi:hypothetical protein
MTAVHSGMWLNDPSNLLWDRALDGRVIWGHEKWIAPFDSCLTDVSAPTFEERTIQLLADTKLDAYRQLAWRDFGPTPTIVESDMHAGIDDVAERAGHTLELAVDEIVKRWIWVMSAANESMNNVHIIRDPQEYTRVWSASLRVILAARLAKIDEILSKRLLQVGLREVRECFNHSCLANPHESILAETVAVYYPLWDRRRFVFNSPWDDFGHKLPRTRWGINA